MGRKIERTGRCTADTSLEAYVSMTPHTKRLQDKILNVLRAVYPHDLTPHEIDGKLEYDKGTTGRRMAELLRRKLVKVSGERRKNASGRNAAAFVACVPHPDLG